MIYHHTVKGTFLRRPNRFIAYVLVNGQEEKCHVKNTGRCRELLIPGVTVVLEFDPDAEAKGRKTAYDVIAVYKEQGGIHGQPLLINMDSQAPNAAAYEWVKDGGLSRMTARTSADQPPVLTNLRREVTYGKSRFDLAFRLDGTPAFLEVKGVTLEANGLAMFPDAPTERGLKHINELASLVSEGYLCFLLLVIQMKDISAFTPNMETQPEFGYALKKAADAGVKLLACDCVIHEDSMLIDRDIKILLPDS